MPLRFKLLLIPALFVIHYSLFVSVSHAITPFAPYSKEGNPSDDYQLKSLFPLLRFIEPAELIVYENQDENRTYSTSCSGTTYYEGSCTSSANCIATTSCNGQKKTFPGTCNIPSGSTSGTCSYPTKNPTIVVDPQSTDFSRDRDPSSDSPNLAYPKYQNESLRYENPGGNNTITWGSHYLTLDRCTRAARQLMVAYQAYETKSTVQKGGEWPLGWVDWGYITRDNNRPLLEVWDSLISAQPNLARIGKQLVDAQDEFLLSLGQADPNSLPSIQPVQQELCNLIKSAPANADWLTSLELLPLYPPSFRQGYVRTSICVYNICKPGKTSDAGQTLYADISVHSALSAAINDLLQNFPLSQSLAELNEIATINPLIRYILISKSIATPTQISRTLDPLSNLKPFTFSSLGSVYDYQSEMDKYGYTLQPTQSQQEGGAFPSGNFLSNLINFSYGIVDAIAPVSNHLLTIPEPMAQTIAKLQQPVYDARDTSSSLRDKYVSTLSNVIDGKTLLLYVAKGVGPGDAKRRLAYFTCRDPEYSAPQETAIKDYALGTRIGCYQEAAPAGQCDGTAFAKLIENSPYKSPLSSADGAFNSIKGQLTPELLNIYGAAASATGVPCEVLAGIHYVEADLNPQGSLVSGRPLGQPEPDAGGRTFKTLLETAVYAGNHLKGKVGNIKDVKTLITALSRYNGGGNSNCQTGYPYPIPYTGCPKQFEGEDDPYPVNWIDDRHSTMYLLYCADLTACEPAVWERMGALTFAVEMYNNQTKGANP